MELIGRKQGRMVTMRELAQDTSRVMNSLVDEGQAACVTRYGRPVALIVPIDSEQIESYLFSAILESVEKEQLTTELGVTDIATSEEMAFEADVDLDEAQSLAKSIEAGEQD